MITLQQLLATPGKENLDAVASLYRSAFFCAQRLISLNIKATQSIMDGNIAVIQALTKARDPSAWNATQTVMMQRFIDRIVSYAGDFNEVVAENQQELSRLLQAYMAAPDAASDSSPATMPMMIKVVQSMLDASLDSRKSMLDMARLVDASIEEELDAAPAPVAVAPQDAPKKAPRRKAAPRKPA